MKQVMFPSPSSSASLEEVVGGGSNDDWAARRRRRKRRAKLAVLCAGLAWTRSGWGAMGVQSIALCIVLRMCMHKKECVCVCVHAGAKRSIRHLSL